MGVDCDHFRIVEPPHRNAFGDFRKAFGGPSEGFFSVKVHGMRPMGLHASMQSLQGAVVRVTLNSAEGSTSSTKPTRIRPRHMELEGCPPDVSRIVRNLRALQPNLTDEEIAEAAEIEPSLVASILEMHELLPIAVNAGFYF